METTFQVHVAVNQIENMIKGRYTAFGWKESVYEIARDSGLCSEELYQFNLELLIEGTTLRVIYLEMKGVVSVLPSLMQELKERIFLNERMYDRYCRKFFNGDVCQVDAHARAKTNTFLMIISTIKMLNT